MLRMILPVSTGHHHLFVVADEVTGQHRMAELEQLPTPDDEERVWDRLESDLGDAVMESLERADQVYAGLRGTTILGSTTLADTRLQLRSRTDVMVLDYELAMVVKKAINAYLIQAPSNTTTIELTEYRTFLSVVPEGVALTVSAGGLCRSRLYKEGEIDLSFIDEAQLKADRLQLEADLDVMGPNTLDDLEIGTAKALR